MIYNTTNLNFDLFYTLSLVSINENKNVYIFEWSFFLLSTYQYPLIDQRYDCFYGLIYEVSSQKPMKISFDRFKFKK